MSTSTNDLFYSRLPVNEIPLSDLLMEEHLFFKVPANWHVIITDVKKSTEAVANGLHETVNLVATGSIVAVLNIVYKENLAVPFFFGGGRRHFYCASFRSKAGNAGTADTPGKFTDKFCPDAPGGLCTCCRYL